MYNKWEDNVDAKSIGGDASPRRSREELDAVVQDRLLLSSLQKMFRHTLRSPSQIINMKLRDCPFSGDRRGELYHAYLDFGL